MKGKLLTVDFILIIVGFFLVLRPVYGVVLFQESDIETSVDNSVQTGENKSEGGTIKTGDGTSSTIITNIVNKGSIECCVTPTPTSGSAAPTPTSPAGQPTPIPTQPPGDGNGGNNGGQQGSGGGIDGGDVAGAAGEQGQILGLAATSSSPLSTTMLQGIGLLCTGIGLMLKRKQVLA